MCAADVFRITWSEVSDTSLKCNEKAWEDALQGLGELNPNDASLPAMELAKLLVYDIKRILLHVKQMSPNQCTKLYKQQKRSLKNC